MSTQKKTWFSLKPLKLLPRVKQLKMNKTMQAKIWNHAQWVKETDPIALRGMFDELLRKAGFNVLSCTEHHFSPQGYTALWLLSESHFAVHTFPEFGRTYIELSSCNLDFYLNFLSMTKEL